jgi:hypothetical protein
LAPLIGVDQELFGFDLAVPQGPVEGRAHSKSVTGVLAGAVSMG